MHHRLERMLPEPLRALGRGVRFALKNAGFQERIIQKEAGDLAFPFLLGDRCGEEWYAAPVPLSPELLFVRSMTQPGDVVLECGTHHGLFTILLAHWIGEQGRIVGFEAAPSSAAIAARNIALNHLEHRVQIQPKAVGAGRGKIRVTDESNAIAIRSESLAGTEVECVPIDDYADLQPTFLKLDVEGFEFDVLQGARRVLERKPKLAIEVHVELLHRFGRSADEIFDYVSSADYDFWLQPGVEATPRRYAGERLSALTVPQVHLYAIPKE